MSIHQNNHIDENFTSFTFKRDITQAKEESTPNSIEASIHSSNGILRNENNAMAENTIINDNKLAKIEQTLAILLKKIEISTNNATKNDELLMMMATKINQLEGTLTTIQQSVNQQKQNTDTEEQEQEIINALRTNNLFLSKIDQKIDQTQKIKLQEYQSNSEELVGVTQVYNLFLSKVEKKLDMLYKIQQSPVKNELQDTFEKYIQTNNLFLSKIEQKIEVLSKAQAQNNAKQALDEILETSKTNALYAAKTTQKIELFERLINNLKQTFVPANNEEAFNEVYTKFETNSYLMAKLDQKIDLIQKNYQDQKNTLQNIENTTNQKQNEEKSILELLNNLPNDLENALLANIKKETENIENKQTEFKDILKEEIQNIQANILKIPTNQVDIVAIIEQQKQEKNDLQHQFEQKNQQMIESFEGFKNQIFDWMKNYNIAFTDIITTFKTEVQNLFVQNTTPHQQDDKVLNALTELKNNLLQKINENNNNNNNNNNDDFADILDNVKNEIIKKIHLSMNNQPVDNTKILTELQQNIVLMAHQTPKEAELKITLEGLQNHIQRIDEMIGKQATQKNTITTNEIPAKEFFNDLKAILENNHKQLAQIEQNLFNFAKEKEQMNPQNLLNGIHTNNLYLSKMEQKFENLFNKISNQQKTF